MANNESTRIVILISTILGNLVWMDWIFHVHCPSSLLKGWMFWTKMDHIYTNGLTIEAAVLS